MKSTIFLTIVLVIIFSLKIATAEDNWVHKVLGTYKSTTWYKGEAMPGSTTLSRTSAGEIVGEYDFLKQGAIRTGEISDCTEQDKNEMSCKWQDEYGNGPLVFTFSKDRQGFEGFWNFDGFANNYSWIGER